MPYEFFIGYRYLLSKKSSLISVVTVISVLGVALGVMALTVTISVVSGFEDYFQSRILGNNSHLVVHKLGEDIEDYRESMQKINSVKGIKGVTPSIYQEVLITNARSKTAGVVLHGADIETLRTASNIAEKMIAGDIDDILYTEDGQPRKGNTIPGVIVGKELALNEMFLAPGSFITVVAPYGELSPFGMGPKMRRFEVVGIFETGLYEYDSKYIYTDLSTIQDFFLMGDKVGVLQISVDDIHRTEKYAKTVREVLGEGYFVRTWQELNRDIFEAFKLEKTTFFIVLTMIVLVASFNIIGTLNMTVMEKGKEISILKSLGATKRSIMKIFISVGFLIGAVGTFLGVFLGYLLCVLFRDYIEFPLNANVYQLSSVPVKMQSHEFAIVAVCALAISFLATLYPSYRGAALDPCEGIRYE